MNNSYFKRITSLILAFIIMISILPVSEIKAAPVPGTGPLVIQEVYGGGGNSGSYYTNDYIVLKNISNEPVLVDGWSIQYASATGTSYGVEPLNGTIDEALQYAKNADNVDFFALTDHSNYFDDSSNLGKIDKMEYIQGVEMLYTVVDNLPTIGANSTVETTYGFIPKKEGSAEITVKAYVGSKTFTK